MIKFLGGRKFTAFLLCLVVYGVASIANGTVPDMFGIIGLYTAYAAGNVVATAVAKKEVAG